MIKVFCDLVHRLCHLVKRTCGLVQLSCDLVNCLCDLVEMNVSEILLWCKHELAKMSLTGNPFVKNWLNFGQFELFNSQPSSKRKLVNRLILFLAFFSTAKFFMIILAAFFGFPDLKLWLIELYLFNEEYQKYLDVSILIIQLGFSLRYFNWIHLDEKAATLESFRFLLIPDDPKDRYQYGRRYQLDQRSTDKLYAVYRFACLFLRLVIVVYSIFALATITRCLYHSFYTVCSVYFFTFSLLLWVATVITWLLVIVFTISRFILVPLSTQFLIYRMQAIDSLICKRFTRTELLSIDSFKKLGKQQTGFLRVLRLLNDFCQQFQQINSVLDDSVSMFLLGVYICIFLLPFFLFFIENDLFIRVFLCFVVLAAYMLCFSFSICNDRLRREVGRIEVA